MITCPSCNHQNPEGSLQCENCYTPLPATTSCPNCGASVQTDATFCGQCGFNLQAEAPAAASLEETAVDSLPNMSLEEVSSPGEMPVSVNNSNSMPETAVSSPIESPWDDEGDYSEKNETAAQTPSSRTDFPEFVSTETINFAPDTDETEFVEQKPGSNSGYTAPVGSDSLDLNLDVAPPTTELETTETTQEPDYADVARKENSVPPVATPAMGAMSGATQLQIQRAGLLHLQSNTMIEIPSDLDVVHFGKPNGHIPPDVDVSGFPDSEVVSRVHADIRIEGDAYFVEDTGSSNGTYINHAPLQKGNRHRLRNGDRIALGKGDLVTFIFQLN